MSPSLLRCDNFNPLIWHPPQCANERSFHDTRYSPYLQPPNLGKCKPGNETIDKSRQINKGIGEVETVLDEPRRLVGFSLFLKYRNFCSW